MITQNNLVAKFSATATMRCMKVGELNMIPTRDIKLGAIKKAKDRLKKFGFEFYVSEAGLVNETKVIRLK
ncbi:hypothetical protein [Petrimonas sp.]|uniref:hypothetical protein n=1 Tax=Petrimonas sp. TaxID=2023866 RepID=UPI002FCC13D2